MGLLGMTIGELATMVDNAKRRAAMTLGELATNPMGLLSRNVDAALPSYQDLQDAQSVVPQVSGPASQRFAQLGNEASGMAPMGLLGVIKPSVANALKFETKLPSAPEFGSAVANTPGASITPDGLLMRVQRNQAPEQGLMESVRGGVFYLPEGAPQAKYYTHNRTPGANNYGGPERITGETLVKNPLFAKGGTGGKAPESAYDSLNGKGAYQTMRNDALHWSGGPREIREEAVDKFLEKYAPEMRDLAGYIIENSKQGNQLAYALQEAAVASAVRRAGHDAVIGHSKGKAGPFISELFDVRESHYPDKFGGYRVWEDLYK